MIYQDIKVTAYHTIYNTHKVNFGRVMAYLTFELSKGRKEGSRKS